jgi:hypothetical protein
MTHILIWSQHRIEAVHDADDFLFIDSNLDQISKFLEANYSSTGSKSHILNHLLNFLWPNW